MAERGGRMRAVFGAGCAVLVLTLSSGGCGGSGSSHQVASSPTSRAASFAAYRQCLSEHSVVMPTERPTPGAPRPTHDASQAAAFREARRACADLRPAGGLRAGGIRSGPRRQFRECMRQHGVELPPPPGRTGLPGEGPSPEPTSGRGGMLAGLDLNDPAVHQAIADCRSILIENRPGPGAGGPAPTASDG